MIEEYRNQGLAQRMLRHILEFCRSVDAMSLMVISDQPADKTDEDRHPWNWWVVKGKFTGQDCAVAKDRASIELLEKEPEPQLVRHSFIPWPVSPKGVNLLVIDQTRIEHLLSPLGPTCPMPQPHQLIHLQVETSSSSMLAVSKLKNPKMVEICAGEAGICSEFSNLGWDCIVHERDSSIPKWGPKLPKETTPLWTELLKDLPTEKIFTAHPDFMWFGNDCRTWGPLGFKHHRHSGGGARSHDAHEANHDADKTAVIIRKLSFTPRGLRNMFTFALENPSGLLKDYPAIRELIEDNRICACVVRVNQCHFGSFRSGKMKGFFSKSTDIITNNRGIIHALGLTPNSPGREWWPDAPGSKFVCGAKSPCNNFKDHPGCGNGKGSRPKEKGDVEAEELSPYPEAFATQIALAVNSDWRTEVAPSNLS